MPRDNLHRCGGFVASLQRRSGATKRPAPRLDKSQIRAKAAIADTPGCAWAIARYGKADIVPAGRASDAIGSLPVAALRLGEVLIESLRDVGIERIAQLASKPRASLQTRFGSDVLLQLRPGAWRDHGSLAAAYSAARCRARSSNSSSLSPILKISSASRRLICGKLMSDLEVRGVGARRLDLVFSASTMSRKPSASVRPSQPGREASLQAFERSGLCWSSRASGSRKQR